MIGNYENRIRSLSSPEKLFTYFSTIVDDVTGERFMTLRDFINAITPYDFRKGSSDFTGSLGPSGKIHVKTDEQRHEAAEAAQQDIPSSTLEFFKLFDTDYDGLISFSEYIFFVSLLSVPPRHAEMAFHMFDIDGNGQVDVNEFRKFMHIIQEQSSLASRKVRASPQQRVEGRNSQQKNQGLIEQFFGKDGNRHLSLAQWTDFLQQLHREVLVLEFTRFEDPAHPNTMSAYDFAMNLAGYARVNEVTVYVQNMDLIRRRYPNTRITFQQYEQFHVVLQSLDDIAFALSTFRRANGDIKRKDFARATRAATNIDLDPDLIDIVFDIFDRNNDGKLNPSEFLTLMQQRKFRGFENSRDTGFVRLLNCTIDCIKKKGQSL